MAKVTVTLDAAKLRQLISTRTYKNKENVDVTVQEVKFELVEVKDAKTVFTGNGFRLDKTHFACAIQTKEEREAKAETVFIGDGVTTVWSNSESTTETAQVATPTKEEADLPF